MTVAFRFQSSKGSVWDLVASSGVVVFCDELTTTRFLLLIHICRRNYGGLKVTQQFLISGDCTLIKTKF